MRSWRRFARAATRACERSCASRRSTASGAVSRLSIGGRRRGTDLAVLDRVGVTAPIVGVGKPEQLDDAVAATSLRLTPEEMHALGQPYLPHPVAGIEVPFG